MDSVSHELAYVSIVSLQPAEWQFHYLSNQSVQLLNIW